MDAGGWVGGSVGPIPVLNQFLDCFGASLDVHNGKNLDGSGVSLECSRIILDGSGISLDSSPPAATQSPNHPKSKAK